MSPHINHPSTGLSTDNPAVTLFTRRTFMKTTALTVGAVALLSQGRALAVEGGDSSSSSWTIKLLTVPKNNAGGPALEDQEKVWRTTFSDEDDHADKLLLGVKAFVICTPNVAEGTLADQFDGEFHFAAQVFSNPTVIPESSPTKWNEVQIANTHYRYQTSNPSVSCTAAVVFRVTNAGLDKDKVKIISLGWPTTDLKGSGSGKIGSTDYAIALEIEPEPSADIYQISVSPTAKMTVAVAWADKKTNVVFKFNWAIPSNPGFGIEISPADPDKETCTDSGSVQCQFICT